jgi:hypothetical protein
MSAKPGDPMDFSPEESELLRRLEPLRAKRPPEALMRDYEKQVMDKIRAPHPGAPWGALPALALAFAAAGAALYFWMARPEPAAVRPVPAAPVESAAPEAAPPAPAEDEALFTQMAADLFILEMLGEDQGLFDDVGRIETDMELLTQTMPVVSS